MTRVSADYSSIPVSSENLSKDRCRHISNPSLESEKCTFGVFRRTVKFAHGFSNVRYADKYASFVMSGCFGDTFRWPKGLDLCFSGL